MSDAPFDVLSLNPERRWFIVPLVGLAPCRSRRLGRLTLTRLDWRGWQLIERTELGREFVPPFSESPVVVGIAEASPDSKGDCWAEAFAIADAAAASLRLAGETEFVEPRLVAVYATSERQYWRKPGYYRQSVFTQLANRDADEHGETILLEADRLYGAVSRLMSRVDEAEGLPLGLYRRSFGPCVGDFGRLLLLFAALESALLPWRTAVNGVRLEARAACAAMLGGGESCEGLLKHLRAARNRLAHGVPTKGDFALAPSMQQMIGAILRCWLRFHDEVDRVDEPDREFNRRLSVAAKAPDDGERIVFGGSDYG